MAENHKLFNKEKINVYEAQDEVAIDVFDISSSGKKPDSAILVTTGSYVPGAISVNITNKIPGSLGVKFVGGDSPVPPVPPVPSLPPYTIRLKYKQGTTPKFWRGTGVIVDETNNIWDLTYENSNWYNLLTKNSDLLEVIDGNTSNVTNMENMFDECTSLTSVSLLDTSNVTNMSDMFLYCYSLTNVSLFDTSKVTNMNSMFNNCTSLTTVPLFDTSKVTIIARMFYNCTNVQSGALELYKQASTQTNPPTRHAGTFTNCGSNTETGAAELAQIPDDWK